MLIFDEFQEIVSLDPKFPNLMRAVFQTQPEVSHVYLGSKRHVLERIFNDKNEPFWRSAKQLELGMIAPAQFAPSFAIGLPLRQDDRRPGVDAHARAQRRSPLRHPGAGLLHLGTRQTSGGGHRRGSRTRSHAGAPVRAQPFRADLGRGSGPQRLLMQALARDPTPGVYAASYHEEHELPANPSLQVALAGLIRKEIAGRGLEGEYRIIEPFLAEWLLREQRDDAMSDLART